MEDRYKRVLVSLISLAMVVMSLAPPILATQQPTGSIEGTVTDLNGAVIPGAKVTITDKATGRPISLTADSDGRFEARALPPGDYSVKIEQSGFAVALLESLTVRVGQVANASTSMKPGGA